MGIINCTHCQRQIDTDIEEYDFEKNVCQGCSEFIKEHLENFEKLEKDRIMSYMIDVLGYSEEESKELLKNIGRDCLTESEKIDCMEYTDFND